MTQGTGHCSVEIFADIGRLARDTAKRDAENAQRDPRLILPIGSIVAGAITIGAVILGIPIRMPPGQQPLLPSKEIQL